MTTEPEVEARTSFGGPEIGAIAHLYRGEMYRSKIWRTRLDATTNWAVVTLGIALSVTFADPQASELPLVLVGGLLCMFLVFEARRYRFFDIWRTRVRVMETCFFGPILRDGGTDTSNGWPEILADDYTGLYFHISYAEALGRRLRRNYGLIFLAQLSTYFGKLIIHPTALQSSQELFDRAAIGPVPGEAVLLVCVLFYGGLAAFAFATRRFSKAVGRAHSFRGHVDRMRILTATEKF
ncbi:MAG: DUF2270 domain-containing protein [Rhodobacter sp.]|nr:DUF2270 domain-containing protein [Rhodobacter sp.]